MIGQLWRRAQIILQTLYCSIMYHRISVGSEIPHKYGHVHVMVGTNVDGSGQKILAIQVKGVNVTIIEGASSGEQ